MIDMEWFQQFMDSAAKLADAVEKHLKDLPADTEMTLALNELRMAQADFDRDLHKILEELEKLEGLTFNENDDKIKTRH